MRKLLLVLGVLATSILSAQQVQRNLTASNGVFIGFWEYKPVDYNSGTKYPVIIFLHGIGERGNGTSDLYNVTNIALPRMIANGNPMRFFWNGKWETFIVLSPQLSYNYGEWQDFYIDEMIKYATNNLSGDPSRIFLTGLSLGGGGVWRYATGSSSNSAKLTAIAPVCPTCQSPNWGNIAVNNLPVWAFHAMDDGVVGWPCTDNAINSINAYNPIVKAKRTLWPDGNHWIWDRAYDPQYNWQNPNLYEWFLGQEKWNPVNVAPVANAGPDVTISASVASVTLNGGGSYDADGAINRYVWTKVSGPGGGTISTPMNASTTVTGLYTTGDYEFELKVADRKAETAVDRIKVTVSAGGGGGTPPPPPSGTNQKPVSKPGNGSTITLPTNNTTLNGSGSYDPDGTIVKYEWTKISGPGSYSIANNASATTALNNLEQGTYSFNLRVWDNLWEPSDAAVTVIVNGGSAPPPTTTNQAPVSKAGNDATVTLPSNTLTLIGSGSYDPDGSIIKYEWRYVSGPGGSSIASPSTSNTTISNLSQGTYTYALRVWDDKWEPSEDLVVVTVNAGASAPPVTGNRAPVSNAGSDVTVNLPSNNVTLNGASSYDPDGTIGKYEWRYVSGPGQFNIANINAASTAINNLAQGTYTFALRVWDNQWEPSEDLVVVTVNAGTAPAPPPTSGNLAPVSKAGNDMTLTLPSNSATLNGVGSYDPDGTLIKYEWRQSAGPTTAYIANVNSVTSPVSGLGQGTYRFVLRIWDNKWEPAEDEMVITVNGGSPAPIPTGNRAPVANAGSDIWITLPSGNVTLNGTGSYDPDGTIGKFEWRKESGPASYSISDVNSVSPFISNLSSGAYVFVLRIWDNQWEPSEDRVVVTVSGTGSVSTRVAIAEPVMLSNTSVRNEALSISPNPALNVVNVRMVNPDKGNTIINVYDFAGRIVKKFNYSKTQPVFQQQLQVSSIPRGAYTLEVITNNSKKSLSRFIKK